MSVTVELYGLEVVAERTGSKRRSGGSLSRSSTTSGSRFRTPRRPIASRRRSTTATLFAACRRSRRPGSSSCSRPWRRQWQTPWSPASSSRPRGFASASPPCDWKRRSSGPRLPSRDGDFERVRGRADPLAEERVHVVESADARCIAPADYVRAAARTLAVREVGHALARCPARRSVRVLGPQSATLTFAALRVLAEIRLWAGPETR